MFSKKTVIFLLVILLISLIFGQLFLSYTEGFGGFFNSRANPNPQGGILQYPRPVAAVKPAVVPTVVPNYNLPKISMPMKTGVPNNSFLAGVPKFSFPTTRAVPPAVVPAPAVAPAVTGQFKPSTAISSDLMSRFKSKLSPDMFSKLKSRLNF